MSEQRKGETQTVSPLTGQEVVAAMLRLDAEVERCEAVAARYPASQPLQSSIAALKAQLTALERLKPPGPSQHVDRVKIIVSSPVTPDPEVA